jgi:monomeric sarcosine oxidase
MPKHADVLVIGTGGVGSGAAFHLARRGVKVIGIDRFPGGHDRGSSHGQTRIIRLAYFEHPDYVPLLMRAYALWPELERLQGERLFHQVGLLEAGEPDGRAIQGILASARQHNLAIEELDAAECRRRFPGYAIPDDMRGVFEATAGYLLVERCVLAHLEQARRHGAELVVGESVIEWSNVGGAVTVRTDKETYHAAKLVLTAGSWAPRLLASLGVPLEVRRKHVHWFPADRTYRQDAGCPTFLFEIPEGEFYGFPDFGDGLKVGEHTGGSLVTDPLNDDRSPEPNDVARVETFLAKYLPGVGRPSRQRSVCYYTLSPDRHFIVGNDPRWPQVAFAAGLSGHGFKFTSVLGEVLADLSTTGETKLPIEFLSTRRFK